MSNKHRVATHAIDPQFIERWSPRAFTGENIPEATLLGFIEAARWAPSAYNSQPWRFLYARRDSADWSRYLNLLIEFNRGWAQHASALLVIVSKTRFVAPGKSEEQPAPSHAFDTGAAWGFFALQAHLAGWHTHAMTGFDKDLARRELKIPDGYEVQAMVAVGKRGDAASLPEALQARETPSPRLALEAIAAEGDFSL
ncbi:nitroreductase family protein [Pseudomonas sp. MAP12]|uniref:Nitroreductase family protein n=1 Tax=Geopseudomonas aromaticivorans TaxID=2849492 RepID=A0ABS6N2W8_9GAMM|nr:nitroreductase family protein [Pseudomonas aromaticivorans]MBV2135019.1 nitroreductase family protein [Pseudomonas aromaticivorans]